MIWTDNHYGIMENTLPKKSQERQITISQTSFHYKGEGILFRLLRWRPQFIECLRKKGSWVYRANSEPYVRLYSIAIHDEGRRREEKREQIYVHMQIVHKCPSVIFIFCDKTMTKSIEGKMLNFTNDSEF